MSDMFSIEQYINSTVFEPDSKPLDQIIGDVVKKSIQESINSSGEEGIPLNKMIPPFGFAHDYRTNQDSPAQGLKYIRNSEPPLAVYPNGRMAAEIDGDIFVVGMNKTGRYNPLSEQWTFYENPAAVANGFYGSAVSYKGELYAMGCFTNNLTLYKLNPESGEWTDLGNGPYSGRNSAAAVLNDEIYFSGSATSNYKQLFKYNPASGSWSVLEENPFPAQSCSCGAINGELYVSGGSTSPYNQFRKYNPGTNTWTVLANCPYNQSNYPGIVIDESYYILGSGTSPYGQFSKYDVESNTWDLMPSIGTNISGGDVAYVDNKIYLFGNSTIRKFDFELEEWELMASLPVTLSNVAGMTLTVHKNDFYYITGRCLLKYNIIEDKWYQLASCPITSSGKGAFLENELYVLGIDGSFAKYNPKKNQWVIIEQQPLLPVNGIRVALDGELYVFGKDTNTNIFQKYNPKKNVWINLRATSYTSSPIAASNGALYAFGHLDNSNRYVNACHKYNPLTDTWAAMAVPPKSQQSTAAFNLDDTHIYLSGGDMYSVKKNTWSTKTATGNSNLNISDVYNSGIYYFNATYGLTGFHPYPIRSVQTVAKVSKGQKVFYASGSESALMRLDGKVLSPGYTIAEEDGYLHSVITEDKENYIRGWVEW